MLARLLYHSAPLVLVDEGTSALDPGSEERVSTVLQTLAQRGSCVVMIAHRKALAARADRLVLLHEGRVAEQGPAAEVMASDAYQRMIGSHQTI